MENENAIVLAMFGTSVEKALSGLLHIQSRMQRTFPCTPVSLAFTSQIISRTWQERAQDTQYLADHPDIPGEIYTVQDPFAVITDLRDTGYRSIVVQPVYMAPGEEYLGLTTLLEDNSTELGRKSSLRLAVGRPALGVLADGPNSDDIAGVAHALEADVNYARERNAALVYMGHGSKDSSTDGLYRQFAATMQQLNPDVLTLVATVESSPTIEETVHVLQEHGIQNILLKPLMVVAGNHVRKDLVGPGPRGWKNRFEQAGFGVEAVLRGLGEQDLFADIFVRRATTAAADAGIELR